MEKNSEFQKLITFFEEIPGVGARQARRFALFLLSKNRGFIEDFTGTLINTKQMSKECPSCLRYHFGQEDVCSICESSERTDSMLLVVEKEQDIESFERTHLFTGKYFVLGKLISLVSKDELRLTRLNRLLQKIEKGGTVDEIILAFPTTPNGTFTDSYVRQEITKQFPTIAIKSLGRGFATGSDPEYADSDTIAFALKNRS
jgi:recombination protein RecR